MLSQISIRDIVLIERLEIDFSNGLSVLTGETGAGKSILLDSLSLALGARGDGGLVRSGAAQGEVSAVFDVPLSHSISNILSEHNIEFEGTLILKRLQTADGRSKASINNQVVSIGLMKEIGSQLVELHGQHDERAMLDPAIHRALIDNFGGLSARVDDVNVRWQEWQTQSKAYEMHKRKVADVAKEADYLRASVEELLLLSPEHGEETTLADQRSRMMKVEKIATDLNDAMETLSGSSSPMPSLTNLSKTLQRKMVEVPDLLDEAVKELDAGIDALYRAQQAIESAVYETHFDPKELENSEERLFALRAAARKYSVAVENLPDLAVRLSDDLENLNAGEEKLAIMEKALGKARAKYMSAAKILSDERKSAADLLINKVMQELPALKLERAEFLIDHIIDEDVAGSEGFDQMEFWVRTNPGSNPGPMIKIASGGELSRFLLALKVALADKGSAPTLVFDEIDTGVGGAVADAIGQRLHRLSEKVQVLSVTHAPQVAALAENHFVIAKTESDEGLRLTTGVNAIFDEQRREEIARMLAGASVTDEARAAAARLMKQPAA